MSLARRFGRRLYAALGAAAPGSSASSVESHPSSSISSVSSAGPGVGRVGSKVTGSSVPPSDVGRLDSPAGSSVIAARCAAVSLAHTPFR